MARACSELTWLSLCTIVKDLDTLKIRSLMRFMQGVT